MSLLVLPALRQPWTQREAGIVKIKPVGLTQMRAGPGVLVPLGVGWEITSQEMGELLGQGKVPETAAII